MNGKAVSDQQSPLLRTRRKRHLISLRIPERVALRVHARLSE
jgi:hypothetical protein